jgi:hypothetical protein
MPSLMQVACQPCSDGEVGGAGLDLAQFFITASLLRANGRNDEVTRPLSKVFQGFTAHKDTAPTGAEVYVPRDHRLKFQLCMNNQLLIEP